MGARGRKRRRADGSIANGSRKDGLSFGRLRFDELGVVLPGALAGAVEICRRHTPLDGGEQAGWDWEAQSDELDAFAEREGVDNIALAIRAEKLLDFLRVPGGDRYYGLNGNSLVIDRALLEFAATTVIDESDTPLVWQPAERSRAEQPEGEPAA